MEKHNQNPDISDIINFTNSQGIKARGTLLRSSENQIVFETYNPYSIVQLSEVLSEVKITRLDEAIYNGKAVVSNLINTGLILIVSATLVDSWSEKFKPDKKIDIANEALEFVSEWHQLNNKIRPYYQLSVGKVRSFLIETNRWIEQFSYAMSSIDHGQLSDNTIDKIAEPFLMSLKTLLDNFESEARQIEISTDISEKDFCKRYAQKELHPLIMQSPFVHRTFSKPLGYAGDYEMVNMMLRNPLEGETSYAKLVNLFFLKAGPAEAHRNRIDILYDLLKEVAIKAKNAGHKAKIFNFACGPALEIQRFIEQEEISENCEFYLLDFSAETLEYTQKTLEECKRKGGNRKVEITYINKSVHDVLRHTTNLEKAKTQIEKDFDLVYCAGLFDYLSDKVCARMLKLFFWQLKPGAIMMATNVHSSNPNRCTMEQLMEWYLIYRDEGGFSSLINEVNGTEKRIYTDKTGYNIFLEMKKSATENKT